jgi:hypothetical protein
MDKGLITFFDITECGLYQIKQKKDPIHIEGNIKDSIERIIGWLKDRDFSDTIPWDAESLPNRSKYYCKSVYTDPKTNDSLLVFWKKHGDDSGKLSGILETAKVGANKGDSVSVSDKTLFGQKIIYGQPLYYWFLPEYNLIASIKFTHSLSSTEAVLEYCKRCIDLRVYDERKTVKTHNVYNRHQETNIPIQKATYTSEDKKHSLVYKIDAKMKELAAADADIARLAASITHIVVRENIKARRSKEARDPIFTIFDKVIKNQSRQLKSQVEVISEVSLTASELTELFKIFRDEYRPEDLWSNIGFKTKGKDDTTKWFNSYVDREYIKVDEYMKHDNTFYTAEYLLKALLDRRIELLSDITVQSTPLDKVS